jgi:hypothetical protein
MSSNDSTGVLTDIFSGLGVGCESFGFGAAPKKDVIGFETPFGLAAGFTGDLLVVDAGGFASRGT